MKKVITKFFEVLAFLCGMMAMVFMIFDYFYIPKTFPVFYLGFGLLGFIFYLISLKLNS